MQYDITLLSLRADPNMICDVFLIKIGRGKGNISPAQAAFENIELLQRELCILRVSALRKRSSGGCPLPRRLDKDG